MENFCPFLKIISFPNFLPVRQYTLLSAAEVIANIRRINRDTEIQDLEVIFKIIKYYYGGCFKRRQKILKIPLSNKILNLS